MNEILKSRFTSAHIALAASIGSGAAALSERVSELFGALEDPLLSASEVKELLGIADNETTTITALAQLVNDSILEKTETTSRPLDAGDVILYRQKAVESSRMRILGTSSRLSDGEVRYEFTIDGRLLRQFARIDRLDSISGSGNQRDEIRKHVGKIAEGIKAGSQVPNSVIVVFDSSLYVVNPEEGEEIPESWVIVKSLQDEVQVPHPTDSTRIIQRVQPVEISIPFRNAAFDDEKPALLVDGQQRSAALALVDVDSTPEFFFSVNALVADADEAKAVFQVANSTVRISTDFSRALLGTISGAHGYQKKEQVRAQAVQLLSAVIADSPFLNLIKMPGSKKGKSYPIAYNTLFAVVSMFSDSSLELESDAAKLAKYVARAFNLVKQVWPIAWGCAPNDSKLMHGAGLRAMSDVAIDLIETNYKANGYDIENFEVWSAVETSLQRLAQTVQWTMAEALSGTATQKKHYLEQITNRQNTNQDITALTTFLNKEVTSLDKAAMKPKKNS
jgi:DGQHR domain-containing protein